MRNLLDDTTIPIPCEECGREVEKSIAWIKRNNKHTCECGTKIALDTSQFKRELAKIERELAKLGKMFK